MKKFLSVLLAAIMLFAVAAPYVVAEDTADLPVVYIEGQGASIYRPDGTQVFPYELDGQDLIMNKLMPLWKQVVQGVATGDYSAYCEKLYEYVIPIFEDFKLGPDGEPTDGSAIPAGTKYSGEGTINNVKTTLTTTTGSHPIYRLHYDWRLSPLEIADDVRDLVDAALKDTGATKVNLVSRCLGSNVAYAYLRKHGTDKVASCLFYIPSIKGIATADALYTGNIKLDANAVEKFLEYYRDTENLIIKDEQTTDLILALVNLLEETKVLGVGLDIYQKIVDAIQVEALPKILKESYGSFPSYWAMLSCDKYEQARDFVFGKEPDPEWAEFIKKIDAYHQYQLDMDEFLTNLGKQIPIAVISQYGMPMIPLSEEANEESDYAVGTKRTSLGATCCNMEETFSKKYIEKATENGTEKYICADKKIDASTCLFPDTTWFIKDLPHADFPDCVNDLVVAFIKGNGTLNVNSNPAFSQFLQFKATNEDSSDDSKGTVTPIKTMADTHDVTQNYTKGPLDALFRFLKKFVVFIVNFIKTQFAKPVE